MNDTVINRVADALSLVVTIVVALGAGALIIWLTSSEPGAALHAFFWGPFTNKFFFGNMLQAAAPLIFTGVGLAIAFQAGAVNLGGEGQVYIGGVAGAAVLLSVNVESSWWLPVAVLAGALAGGIFAALAGWLRTRFGATEVITSFLIGAALIQLFDFLLRRYLVDPQAGFPATPSFAQALRLPRILPPSNLNISFFIGLALAVIVYVVLFRTGFGYQLRMTGSNPRFARFSGIDTRRMFVIAMLLSGAFAGTAAVMEVAGVHGRLVTGFSNNLGWNGITVALVARLHPLGVVPAALLYGYLHAGANTANLLSDVSPRVAVIIQSLIFYMVTAQALYVWFRRTLIQRSERRAQPAPTLNGETGEGP